MVNFFSPRTGRMFPHDFEKDGEEIALDSHHSISVNDSNAYTAAAVAGLGVLWLPDYVAAAHAQRGELVRVLTDWQVAPMPLHIAFRPNRHVRRQAARVRRLGGGTDGRECAGDRALALRRVAARQRRDHQRVAGAHIHIAIDRGAAIPELQPQVETAAAIGQTHGGGIAAPSQHIDGARFERRLAGGGHCHGDHAVMGTVDQGEVARLCGLGGGGTQQRGDQGGTNQLHGNGSGG
jgi:hypothetical protein